MKFFGYRGKIQALTEDGGRCSGLMVSVLDSGASAPGSNPGWGHCVVFLGKTLYYGAFGSTQECKWVPCGKLLGNLANCGGVIYDGLASRPGEVENSLQLHAAAMRQSWLQGFTHTI